MKVIFEVSFLLVLLLVGNACHGTEVNKLLSGVPWHTMGEFSGPCFYADGQGLERAVNVYEKEGLVVIEARIKNPTSHTLDIKDGMASLRLGINTSMEDPNKYLRQFFPTMLRCEKTHLWGYFQSPDGRVLAISSPDAVASWHYDYAGLGHRINTVTLDLMNPLPLPNRHPQNLTSLKAGEEKIWHICLMPVNSVGDVPRAIAEKSGVPMFFLERTTLGDGECTDVYVYGNHPKLTLVTPLGKRKNVKLKSKEGKSYFTFTAKGGKGEYKLLLADGSKLSEALLFVRPTWSWYLQQADHEASLMEQKAMQHREGWMGFFSNSLVSTKND